MEIIKYFIVLIIPGIFASFSSCEKIHNVAVLKKVRSKSAWGATKYEKVGGHYCKPGESQSYVAGVVEYMPMPIDGQSPFEAILQNVKNFEELIRNAGNHNVDIIVFPEYGLTTVAMPSERKLARDFMVEVPQFGTTPCNDNSTSLILQLLSCASKRANLYAVINLGEIAACDPTEDLNCPTDGAYYYNTNVVFDRNGTIIARYRKYHLYFEPQFNVPQLEYSTFQTDFEVEFGIFTCFDIIFAHPAVEMVASKGIKNFVFPTAWIDELPFLTAIQAQSLWAQSNLVNLLASGYHNPERGSMGSGIYSGHLGALNYTFHPGSGTKLIIATVPIPTSNECNNDLELGNEDIPLNEPSINSITPRQSHTWLREDLSNSSHKSIDPKINEELLCHLDLYCCKLEYKLSVPEENAYGQFKLVAFEGRRTVAAKTDYFEWQVCAVLHCINEALESCTELEFSEAGSPYHAKFSSLRLQAWSIKMEYEGRASQPALSLIDTRFHLIPQSYFEIRSWQDPITNVTFSEAVSKITELLSEVNVKTIALIQKFYNGR